MADAEDPTGSGDAPGEEPPRKPTRDNNELHPALDFALTVGVALLFLCLVTRAMSCCVYSIIPIRNHYEGRFLYMTKVGDTDETGVLDLDVRVAVFRAGETVSYHLAPPPRRRFEAAIADFHMPNLTPGRCYSFRAREVAVRPLHPELFLRVLPEIDSDSQLREIPCE